MKCIAKIALVLAISLPLTGCFTFEHQVGEGSTGRTEVESRQWFAFWGLLPMNEVDSQQLAGGATNYKVTTQFTVLDAVISFFTSFATIYVQTVRVER